MRTPRTAREAAWLSLVHWRKMIRWVEKQDPDEPVGFFHMQAEISTNWDGQYCALCTWTKAWALRHRERKGNGNNVTTCSFCPLAKKYGPCGGAINAWAYVSMTFSWKEWLKHGRRMEQQLEAVWKELQ